MGQVPMIPWLCIIFALSMADVSTCILLRDVSREPREPLMLSLLLLLLAELVLLTCAVVGLSVRFVTTYF